MQRNRISEKLESEFDSSLDEDSYNSENIHLSLVLDDDNTVSLDLNLKDNLTEVCRNLCKKYNLDRKLADKLKHRIEKHMKEMTKKNKHIDADKESVIVNRLHYEGLENKKKKEKLMEQLKKEETENEIKKYTFTPVISMKSNRNYVKPYLHFEDKLYYDDMISKNKTQMRRIVKGIEDKVECKQFVYNSNLQKRKSKEKKNLNKNQEKGNKSKNEKDKEMNNKDWSVNIIKSSDSSLNMMNNENKEGNLKNKDMNFNLNNNFFNKINNT